MPILQTIKVNQVKNQISGINYFEVAINYGLQPRHECVDYEYDNLHVDQHLIDYLQSENYIGLDIVSDFFVIEKTLLLQQMLDIKKPQLEIINPITIKAAGSQTLHFIDSFAAAKSALLIRKKECSASV